MLINYTSDCLLTVEHATNIHPQAIFGATKLHPTERS